MFSDASHISIVNINIYIVIRISFYYKYTDANQILGYQSVLEIWLPAHSVLLKLTESLHDKVIKISGGQNRYLIINLTLFTTSLS